MRELRQQMLECVPDIYQDQRRGKKRKRNKLNLCEGLCMRRRGRMKGKKGLFDDGTVQVGARPIV